MKLSKTKVVALALAVCLIAVLSMGSLAWFTDDDSVTNDFFIAGSEDENPDKVFSVDVWEDATSEDKDGEAKIQTGIEYPAIVPGDDLYKEVNIENTGAYEQYVRAIVTVSDAHIWQQLHGTVYVPLEKIATDLNPDFKVWSTEYDAEANTLTYVLYYQNILEAGKLVTLSTNVAIPEAMTREQAAKMAGGFNISVTADAVQTKNVGATAPEAFATVGMAIAEGNRTINVTAENVDDVLSILANNKDAEVKLDMTDKVVEQPVLNQGTLDITGGTIDIEAAGLENHGEATLTDVKMEAGSDKDYSNILYKGSTTTYENVEINSNGGGIGAVDGAEATFESGSLIITANTTNPRYNFYVEGEGTEVTINGGTFDFTAKSLKRAYIYAGAGTTVYVNGGNFGTASTRSGYTAGILGDGTVIITGGTFGFNPSKWVADGYEAVLNGSTWTVQAK